MLKDGFNVLPLKQIQTNPVMPDRRMYLPASATLSVAELADDNFLQSIGGADAISLLPECSDSLRIAYNVVDSSEDTSRSRTLIVSTGVARIAVFPTDSIGKPTSTSHLNATQTDTFLKLMWVDLTLSIDLAADLVNGTLRLDTTMTAKADSPNSNLTVPTYTCIGWNTELYYTPRLKYNATTKTWTAACGDVDEVVAQNKAYIQRLVPMFSPGPATTARFIERIKLLHPEINDAGIAELYPHD